MTDNKNGLLTSDFSGMAGGKWAEVVKSQPGRQITVESDFIVPALKTAFVSASITLPVIVIGCVAFPGKPAWIVFGLTLALNMAYWSNVFFQQAQETVMSIEEYKSQTDIEGKSEKSEVRISVIEDGNSPGYNRILNTDLNTDRETLSLVCRENTKLSKRGLMSLGLDDTASMNLLNQLVNFGYATRESQNQPAQWTKRGFALVRAFAGGGGGGGAVLDVETTSETSME